MSRVNNYRMSYWFDPVSLKEYFGIEAEINRRWLNLAENGVALFYESQLEAKEKLDSLIKSLRIVRKK